MQEVARLILSLAAVSFLILPPSFFVLPVLAVSSSIHPASLILPPSFSVLLVVSFSTILVFVSPVPVLVSSSILPPSFFVLPVVDVFSSIHLASPFLAAAFPVPELPVRPAPYALLLLDRPSPSRVAPFEVVLPTVEVVEAALVLSPVFLLAAFDVLARSQLIVGRPLLSICPTPL